LRVRLIRKDLRELLSSEERVLGFWGVPPRNELEAAAARFPDLGFFDLDVFHGAPAQRLVPDAYCHIIRNCVDNALALGAKLACVVAATGREKCDAGRFAARLVAEAAGTSVIETTNEGFDCPNEALLSEARGPLKRRMIRMMETVIEPLTEAEKWEALRARCEPTHGFWGTPPHPVELLDLFPDTTHVFGWSRCVERGRPADLDLETHVPEGLPIVFFSQGFCAKSMLAKRLATRHRGLYVDVHDSLGAATMAKIEAFVRLSARR
jgi:hypothetical protein